LKERVFDSNVTYSVFSTKLNTLHLEPDLFCRRFCPDSGKEGVVRLELGEIEKKLILTGNLVWAFKKVMV
jgi:hypothetical protein